MRIQTAQIQASWSLLLCKSDDQLQYLEMLKPIPKELGIQWMSPTTSVPNEA